MKMKEKITQARSNPYPYSDSNKRYYTYDYYLRQTFGGKCAKIPIDAGSPAQILTADVALAVAFTAREEEAAILLRAVCFR